MQDYSFWMSSLSLYIRLYTISKFNNYLTLRVTKLNSVNIISQFSYSLLIIDKINATTSNVVWQHIDYHHVSSLTPNFPSQPNFGFD